ncbi:MAG TPA: DUF488 family protein, partial [Bdellovibrionales bacterium]|nr:DUF488 family protein [Bdellovibrionales bacterium]
MGDIFSGKVTREDGHIVVVMRHYPRFLRREYRDEYVYALAPPRLLFEHFRLIKTETLDHAYAFKTVKYENEFWLEPEGLAALKRLAKRSEREDVFLVCQCTVGEHCHRELLMLMAREL